MSACYEGLNWLHLAGFSRSTSQKTKRGMSFIPRRLLPITTSRLGVWGDSRKQGSVCLFPTIHIMTIL